MFSPIISAVMEREVTNIVDPPIPSKTAAPYVCLDVDSVKKYIHTQADTPNTIPTRYVACKYIMWLFSF